MTSLASYLSLLDGASKNEAQTAWYKRLETTVSSAMARYAVLSSAERKSLHRTFDDWVRTEEIKAWYSEPDEKGLFQGTSVTSISLPALYSDPQNFSSIEAVEEAIAQSYIDLHDTHAGTVQASIMENTDKWMSEGLFYGVVLGSKVISQAFDLVIDASQAVFDVDGVLVDPHEITTYAPQIRQSYFKQCCDRLTCFAGIEGLTQTELETALVLADISKPHIGRYREKILLAPIRCNEIAALLAQRVTRKIREKTQGRIAPRSLMVTIYDTDTPYTYHQIAGYFGKDGSPVLPGLTILGASGTIDAFRWLYAYRASLVAQKIMKGSLYSETTRRFTPFVFFGVLVERDAEILLDLDKLSLLRYRGNISPMIEFAYLSTRLGEYLSGTSALSAKDDLSGRFR